MKKTMDAFRQKPNDHGGDIEAISSGDDRLQSLPDLPASEFFSTPHGIRTRFPVVPLARFLPPGKVSSWYGTIPLSEAYLAILSCAHKDFPDHLLGHVCHIPPSQSDVQYLHCGYLRIDPEPNRGTYHPDLFPLSPATIARCLAENAIQLKTVYISHPQRTELSETDRMQPHETINLVLRSITRDALRRQGYEAELQGPDGDHERTHRLRLSGSEHTIDIEVKHILQEIGRMFHLAADVKLSRRAGDGEVQVATGSKDW